SRRRHTRSTRDWSSDVCSSDLSMLRVQVGLVSSRCWFTGAQERPTLKVSKESPAEPPPLAPRTGELKTRLPPMLAPERCASKPGSEGRRVGGGGRSRRGGAEGR